MPDSVRQPLGAEEIQPGLGCRARPDGAHRGGNTGISRRGRDHELLQPAGAIQFDVNLEAANNAHLKISSRLLVLARHIMNHAEAAKS